MVFKYNLSPVFTLNQDLLSTCYLFSSTLVREGKVIKVFDKKTNTTTSYPSIRKAALALNVDIKSFNKHLKTKSILGLTSLYRGQYLITSKELYSSESDSCARANTRQASAGQEANEAGGINIDNLPLNKFFVYHADMTLAYVFSSLVEIGRTLTPERCKKFTDCELSKNKNMQHILRVINKGTLTKTELGKFYILKNPGYSNSLALVV